MSAGPEPPGGAAPVLELDQLSLSFGGLRALSELDLQVQHRSVAEPMAQVNITLALPLRFLTE